MVFEFFKSRSIGCALIVVFTTAFFFPPKLAYAAAGDGLIAYGEGTVTTPRYRTWTASSSTWGSENSAGTAAATINWVKMKSSPITAGERIMATLGTAASNNLVVQRWNGSSWSSGWTATNSNNTYHGVDIAYENLTGHALVVYADGTSTPKYQIWNGSSWTSGSITLSTSIGTINKVRLTSKINSNTIAAVFEGATAYPSTNVNAKIWDGNSWGNEPTSGLGSSANYNWERLDYGVAYETASADLMVAWTTYTTSPYWAYATLVGTTWTKVTNPSAFTGAGESIELTADPSSSSSQIAMTFIDEVAILNAGRWNGSSWSLDTNLDTAADKTYRPDVAFAGTTGNAIIVYADIGATQFRDDIDWYRSVGGAAFTKQSDVSGAGAYENLWTLTPDANSSKIMAVRLDVNNDIFAYVYNDSDQSWTTTNSGTALETSASSTYESVAFAYESVFNIPTLGMTLTVVVITSFIAIMAKRRVILLKPSPA